MADPCQPVNGCDTTVVMDTPAWPQVGSGAVAHPCEPRPEAAPRRVFGALGFMLDAFTRRRSGRIALWTLIVSFTMGGLWLLAYPVITDIWANRIQNGLEGEFEALAPNRAGNGYAQTPGEGDALTRLRIPKLGVDVIVVEGVTGNALRAGAGHFPESALPGAPTGNVAIAGHRTGYGEPFRHIDRLKKGEAIILHTPFGTFLYRVMAPFDGHGNPWITVPTDLTVKGNTAEHVVTLVTCDPPGTSRNRLIVRARFARKV